MHECDVHGQNVQENGTESELDRIHHGLSEGTDSDSCTKGKSQDNDSRTEEQHDVAPKDLKTKGIDAAVKFIEQRGWEIIQRDFEYPTGTFDIIAYDDGIIFIKVNVHKDFNQDDLKEEEITGDVRRAIEWGMISWISIHDEYTDMPLRYDVIDIFVLSSNDRAVIKHHINAIGYKN